MNEAPSAAGADYDFQARQNHWHPEVLFGLCYEYLHSGDRLLDIGIGTGLGAEPFARAGFQFSPRKELRLRVRTGRDTEDVFPVFVTQQVVSS